MTPTKAAAIRAVMELTEKQCADVLNQVKAAERAELEREAADVIRPLDDATLERIMKEVKGGGQ